MSKIVPPGRSDNAVGRNAPTTKRDYEVLVPAGTIRDMLCNSVSRHGYWHIMPWFCRFVLIVPNLDGSVLSRSSRPGITQAGKGLHWRRIGQKDPTCRGSSGCGGGSGCRNEVGKPMSIETLILQGQTAQRLVRSPRSGIKTYRRLA